jgi:hypothetical protein
MNSKQIDQIMEQLPKGSRITKVYNAFENSEIRIVVKYAGEDRENRYVVAFEGDYPRIKLKP